VLCSEQDGRKEQALFRRQPQNPPQTSEGRERDLIYLDPPFNSSATYNVLFKEKSGEESAAQITAFEDTWQWGLEPEAVYKEIVESGPRKLADLMQALHRQPPTAEIGKLLYDIRAILAPRL
jgi:hypothetical protein